MEPLIPPGKPDPGAPKAPPKLALKGIHEDIPPMPSRARKGPPPVTPKVPPTVTPTVIPTVAPK